MFTDGLVEEPGRSLDDALAELSALIAAPGQPDAELMCDRVLSAMAAGSLRDDIALLALRLTLDPANAAAYAAVPTSTQGLLEGNDEYSRDGEPAAG
jgi:hypothetical protein